MNRSIHIHLCILMILLFTSCATHYNSVGYRGGYSEIRIDENTYEVTFKGNGYTCSETIKRYFLYHCAELTNEKGYSYFIILNKNIDSAKEITGYNDNVSTVTRTTGNGIVKMYIEKPEGDVVYNATELKESLNQYINRGKNSLM
ncbi:hypothetical protein OU798_04455 [Prolixibacteraceae bacterium Z1-6]|uniref:Lipoprotein n=1 Tax=Draconibacterium aestuarii TaxID=2998507 RepID=A0A9X3J4Q9_9BACT|nr:hypothetical protein [Prolixibacteraceae bacterium Z1-6]